MCLLDTEDLLIQYLMCDHHRRMSVEKNLISLRRDFGKGIEQHSLRRQMKMKFSFINEEKELLAETLPGSSKICVFLEDSKHECTLHAIPLFTRRCVYSIINSGSKVLQ